MIWLAVIALAVGALLIAAILLRVGRSHWTMLGAVLVFGLAGYAWQGSPQLPSAPKQAIESQSASGEALVEARRALFGPTDLPTNYLIVSDGFARRGDFEAAARLLRKGLEDNPKDGEGWLALGNALVEHAGGNVTPAATEAYARAEANLPGNPGPAFFLGAALLRSGDLKGARDVWANLLEASPNDAPWREQLEARIGQMDMLIAQIEAQGAPE